MSILELPKHLEDVSSGPSKDFFKHVSCALSLAQVGYDMTRMAAKKCFEAAGLRPSDVDVVELHDCFSANELITYEALELCAEGENAAHLTLFFELLSGRQSGQKRVSLLTVVCRCCHQGVAPPLALQAAIN